MQILFVFFFVVGYLQVWCSLCVQSGIGINYITWSKDQGPVKLRKLQ